MTKILVTRGGQITLTKEIRKKFGIKEGDLVNINSIGEIIIISKKNPETFNIHGFLPESLAILAAIASPIADLISLNCRP